MRFVSFGFAGGTDYNVGIFGNARLPENAARGSRRSDICRESAISKNRAGHLRNFNPPRETTSQYCTVSKNEPTSG